MKSNENNEKYCLLLVHDVVSKLMLTNETTVECYQKNLVSLLL